MKLLFTDVIGHILARKSLSEPNFEEKDYLNVQKIFMQAVPGNRNKQLENAVKAFVGKYYGNSIVRISYELYR